MRPHVHLEGKADLPDKVRQYQPVRVLDPVALEVEVNQVRPLGDRGPVYHVRHQVGHPLPPRAVLVALQVHVVQPTGKV